MVERLNMAEPGGTEGSGPEAPPPGVTKSAYEVWRATWGGRNPLENVRGELVAAPEAELTPEGKQPDEVVSIMQRIDTMDAETRETKKDTFQQACDILKAYAHKSKLLGLDAKTILLEEDLKRTDQVKISEVEQGKPGQGGALQELSDNLDATDEELRRIDNTLRDDQFRGLFSEKAWKQLQETSKKLAEDKAKFEQAITGMTNPAFLTNRNDAKVKIRQAQEEAEIKTRQEKEKAIKEQFGDPEDWELELEQLLLQDAEPSITQPAQVTFAEQLQFFREQQRLKEEGIPLFRQENLDQAREGLSWYLHETRKLGVFEDLEEGLGHKYREWANSLLPHRETSQMDMLTDSPGRLTQKTFTEVEDEIIKYFNSLLDSKEPQYVEQPARWDFLQRRGLPPAARGALQGIRAEFVRRAQAQIEDSLFNLDRQLKGQPPIPPPDRVSGEWNVHRLERGIRERRERQMLETGSEPMYREESYYRIILLGNTRQELEMGADQAAENIIQSATTFDLQAMQQRMEMLLKALRVKSTDLQRSEKVSKSEAEAIITQIEDSVTNKIDFFILDWAGQNLQMDLFNSYLEQRVRIRGVEKLRQMPAMTDGLVGIALLHLLSDQYRLYHRPQGFKGQMFDDDTTHKYLRGLLKSQLIGRLMEYELKGETDEEKNLSRQNLTKASTTDQFLSNFERREFPVTRLERLRQHYQQIAEQVKELKAQNKATFEDLARLREARKELAWEQRRYQETERRANSAFTIAAQVMNIFGDAAELGAPSIRMDNGDYIRLDEVDLFYKYAILQAAKEYGRQYGAEDNLALIRWRSRMWIQRWKEAGLNRDRADRVFAAGFNGNKLPVTLAKGFEETGLTEHEWQAFENAVEEIRANGFRAQINGVKFEDIIKKEELKAVRNNFLADYKSSESQINNEIILEEVAKGRLPAIRNILRKLGLTGREGIPGNTTQQRIDNLTQMIEDSRSLDAELERLTYFEATHGLPQAEQDPRMLSFSADRIDFGFQNESWGVKRLHHLKAFWYANLRRTTPRAVDLIHAMPFSLGSLAQEMTFDNILDLAWNVNTTVNGLESVDNPALTLFAERHKDMVYLRTRSEGTLVDVGGTLSKIWGFLEKPLVDANALWLAIKGIVAGATPEMAVQMLVSGQKELTEDSKEQIVKVLWGDEGGGHLGRFAPIVHGTEVSYGEHRQATSSGAGWDENDKFALRFLEWLLSNKVPTEEHRAREEGGLEAYVEVGDIIRFIAKPGSYRAVYKKENGKQVLDLEKSSSIWDEVWRKLIPSHNIRLPARAPEPTYLAA